MTRNEFNLLYAIKKYGQQSFRKMSSLADVSTGFISKTTKKFQEKGWTDAEGITLEGIDENANYYFFVDAASMKLTDIKDTIYCYVKPSTTSLTDGESNTGYNESIYNLLTELKLKEKLELLLPMIHSSSVCSHNTIWNIA